MPKFDAMTFRNKRSKVDGTTLLITKMTLCPLCMFAHTFEDVSRRISKRTKRGGWNIGTPLYLYCGCLQVDVSPKLLDYNLVANRFTCSDKTCSVQVAPSFRSSKEYRKLKSLILVFTLQ